MVCAGRKRFDMKKVLLSVGLLVTAFTLAACGTRGWQMPDENEGGSGQPDVEITLWTYPVGNWGNPTASASLIAGFHEKHPNVDVEVEYLSYDNGDELVEQAIADGSAPDLVLEGPERLVANWGAKGQMVDLPDLWESDTAGGIYENVRQACRGTDGAYYEFPICMAPHCMAINYDMFQAAGALAYIDEKTHTWTTDGFIKAVEALKDYGQEHVGVVYCKNQSGDQGTRALVNNLYGGTFTDNTHTSYTVDSKENIRALRLLYDLEGIDFEPSYTAADEIDLFCRKELAMAFCWNSTMEIRQTINHPELNFEIFPMAFPTDAGQPRLTGGIWGFGVFDNGDGQKIQAAKEFIRYLTEDDDLYKRAVRTSSCWPVRDMGNVYTNDRLMTEYSIFMPYMGDYYQVVPDWADARTAWWKMLQEIAGGADAAQAVKGFPEEYGRR